MANPYEQGSVFKQVIRSFNGGILEDKREQGPANFSITKHFDTLTYATKLVPYVQTKASLGLSGAPVTDLKITRLLYAQNQSSSLFRLYGLGIKAATNLVKLFKFDIDGASDLDTANWVACTNGESASGARNTNVFFYYKGFIYTFSGTTALNRFDTLEIAGWADGWQTLGTTTTPIQPVLHPSDDVAYFFSDNIVYSLNNITWNGAVLTLPADFRIVAAKPHGNYLAIACTTLGTFNVRSIVFLWDRDSSLTTLTERIDFGEGAISHLASLGNKLTAVMGLYLDNAYGLAKWEILVKQQNGTTASIINRLNADTIFGNPPALPQAEMERNNKLYFPAAATLNGDTRLGVWVVDDTGRLALDFYEPTATSYDGIFATANVWWMAHSANGSLSRFDVHNVYSPTYPSIYETLILSTIFITGRGSVIQNNNVVKKLVGVTVHTEPIPTGGSIVLKYRIDGATSWTTIFTFSTVGGLQHSALNIESTMTNFPEYKEIEFRVESYGGTQYLGLEYAAETSEKDLY